MATHLAYAMTQYNSTYGPGTGEIILTYDGNSSSCTFYLGGRKSTGTKTEYYYDGIVQYSLNGGSWTDWVTLNSSKNTHTMYFNSTNNTIYYAAVVNTSVSGITDYTRSGVVKLTLTNIGTISFRVVGRRDTSYFQLWHVNGLAWRVPTETVVFNINFGVVRIYDGSWKTAIPYVYNSGWKQAIPYVYNSGWKVST